MMVRKAKSLCFHSTLLHDMLARGIIKTNFEIVCCVLTLEFVSLHNKSWLSFSFVFP